MRPLPWCNQSERCLIVDPILVLIPPVCSQLMRLQVVLRCMACREHVHVKYTRAHVVHMKYTHTHAHANAHAHTHCKTSATGHPSSVIEFHPSHGATMWTLRRREEGYWQRANVTLIIAILNIQRWAIKTHFKHKVFFSLPFSCNVSSPPSVFTETLFTFSVQEVKLARLN